MLHLVILLPGNTVAVPCTEADRPKLDEMIQTACSEESTWLSFEAETWAYKVKPKAVLGYYFKPVTKSTAAGDEWKQDD